MEIIDLPPKAPTLIESTRAIGYSLEAAVADLIDNSIAANATKIWISFFPLNDAYVSILDNGFGMDSIELTTAMQYGSQSPLADRDEFDLGRFGLGLKTASLSQCRILTVATKKNGHIEARKWDIDFIKTKGNWSLISLKDDIEIEKIPDIDRLRELTSGTLVVWENLDRMKEGVLDFIKSMGQKFDQVREHLALVYHRYLSGEDDINKLSITINNFPIEPVDPFLIKKSDQTMQEEIFKIKNSLVRVQPFILPHISKMSTEEIKVLGGKEGLRRQQGFYVYRNKRLIVWGTWFRMLRKGELSKLARIRVDIPNSLDNLWTLDIKKSFATPPEEVRNALANIIEKLSVKSKVKFTQRGKKETDGSQTLFWIRMKSRNGDIYYEINRNHPFVLSLCSQLKSSGPLFALLTQIERTLPLNQLYVDMNNDTHFENEKVFEDSEIELCIKNMLEGFNTRELKIQFINSLKSKHLFNEFNDVIERILNRV